MSRNLRIDLVASITFLELQPTLVIVIVFVFHCHLLRYEIQLITLPITLKNIVQLRVVQ